MTTSNSNGANFMILDSCRNDRFTDRHDKSTRARGTVRPKLVEGTLIAYSADEGQVAKDGTKQGFSLYTKHLIGVLNQIHVEKKAVPIIDALGTVKRAVYNESKIHDPQNPQNPRIKDDKKGIVCFGFLGCEQPILRFPRVFPRGT